VDGEDVDALKGVDEANGETLGGSASRGGNVTNALTVDVARVVAGYILGQPEESIPSEAHRPCWRPDQAREVVTSSCSHSELAASPVLD